MIKFFRNIRKKLITENQSVIRNTNYFKYAIGEILLVVVGILIALQVNNWNHSRLERKEEKTILVNLHNEFLENKKKLDNATTTYNGALNANMILMNLIGKSTEELQKYNLDSLFAASLPSLQIVFSNNTIKNIVETGKLDIIKRYEMVQLINQWEATTIMIKEREQLLNAWINNQLLPLINDYVSFKKIDYYTKMPWGGTSELKPDYYTLFHLLKYENIQDNVLWYHNKNLAGLKIANDLVLKIINATESYKN